MTDKLKSYQTDQIEYKEAQKSFSEIYYWKNFYNEWNRKTSEIKNENQLEKIIRPGRKQPTVIQRIVQF